VPSRDARGVYVYGVLPRLRVASRVRRYGARRERRAAARQMSRCRYCAAITPLMACHTLVLAIV